MEWGIVASVLTAAAAAVTALAMWRKNRAEIATGSKRAKQDHAMTVNTQWVSLVEAVNASLVEPLRVELERERKEREALSSKQRTDTERIRLLEQRIESEKHERACLEMRVEEAEETLLAERSRFIDALRYIQELLQWASLHVPGEKLPLAPESLRKDLG